ncbi:hypothetical protein [Haloferula sp. BvORR071]|uniref:hypothetical protein n=1 Tax=Haloferula sp. BvORR071 TaxID=1396141 RepID=UPI000554CC41|nr:hypothetical protein [Haloferula sp. BvORR071]
MVYRFLLPLVLLFSLPSANAAYETWTRSDGKSAEMEFLKLEKVDGEEMVTFRTRAGNSVTMKLVDLLQPDWKRARDAAAAATPAGPPGLTLEFHKAIGVPPKPLPDGKTTPEALSFQFVVKGESYVGIKKDSLVVEPFEIGGKAVPAKSWQASSGSGPSAYLMVEARGDFDLEKFSGCKLAAKVTALRGTKKQSTKVEAKVNSKTGKSELKVGPVVLDFHHSYATTNGVERHFLYVEPNYAGEKQDPRQIIKCALESDGKEVRELAYEKGMKSVTVAVDYWEDLVESELELKATAP